MDTMLVPDSPPLGYPTELERWLRLGDGRRVFVRPMVNDDVGQLAIELERADEETIYQRFFRAPVRLTTSQLDRLTQLDYRSRLALAAFDENGLGLGVVRYEGEDAAATAEIAIVVRKEWRHLGLASMLLGILEEAAIERGIEMFTALYLLDNGAIAALLARCGFEFLPNEGGLGVARKALPVA